VDLQDDVALAQSDVLQLHADGAGRFVATCVRDVLAALAEQEVLAAQFERAGGDETAMRLRAEVEEVRDAVECGDRARVLDYIDDNCIVGELPASFEGGFVRTYVPSRIVRGCVPIVRPRARIARPRGLRSRRRRRARAPARRADEPSPEPDLDRVAA
jgi:hypothetical protein